MASWAQVDPLVLLMLVVIGAYAGPVTTESENVIAEKLDLAVDESPSSSLPSSSYDDLANHTTAVVEFVLQNLHRLKNYQERERLERLVTRFKTLVDQLGSHQLQNNINSQVAENAAEEPSEAGVKYPFTRNQLSQNVMQLKDKQFEKLQPHRGRLSITLLPRGEEPSRKLQLARQAASTAPAAIMASNKQEATPQPSQQPSVSKPNTAGMESKHLQQLREDDAADDAVAESDESADEKDGDDGDELVEELHQTTYKLSGAKSKQHDSLSDSHSVNLNDDQLIELNDKRYNPITGNQVGNTLEETNNGGWDSGDGATVKSPNTHQLTDDGDDSDDDDDDDEEDDDDDDDFIDPTESHQLDDDVKLLNKVIGNLRQVKEVLRRLRFGEERTR